MRITTVPSSWLETNDRRLDCGPYMSGAVEAKVLLDGLSASKDPLYKVTLGRSEGYI